MRPVTVIFAAALLATMPLRADQEPKNVQVLKGLTHFQLIRVMQLMQSSLGVQCDHCHATVGDPKHYDFASDAKNEKLTARKMILMVRSINADNFAGRPAVSCNSCHRGANEPVGLVPLPLQQPAKAETVDKQRPALPTRDEIVSKYATAIGKPSRALWDARSLVGARVTPNGKSVHYTIDEANGMAHLKATIGDDTFEQALTPTSGWSRNSKGTSPMDEYQLAVFRTRQDAFSPPLPESIPADARVVRKATDGDHDVYVVFYKSGPSTRERLDFDTTTGLLVRRVSLTDTPVGVHPQQTDFDDWRNVGGDVKYPFAIRLSEVEPADGDTRNYSEVKLGVALDEKALVMPQ